MTYRAGSSRPAVLVIALNGAVLGIDVATGGIRWQQRLDSAQTIRLFVNDEIVLALNERLVCLRYPDGAMLWRSGPLRAEIHGGSMLAYGEHVFVSGGGHLACLSIHDGRQIWHNPLNGMGLSRVAMALPHAATQVDESS